MHLVKRNSKEIIPHETVVSVTVVQWYGKMPFETASPTVHI